MLVGGEVRHRDEWACMEVSIKRVVGLGNALGLILGQSLANELPSPCVPLLVVVTVVGGDRW